MQKLIRYAGTVGFVLFGLTGTVTSCKENTIDAATTNNTNNTATNVIGPSGGIVLGPDGSSLRVPAGALTKDTTITIAVAEPNEYPGLPTDYSVVSKVYSFEPHGLAFLSPAIITIPFQKDGLGNQGLTGLHGIPGGSWSTVPAQIAVDAQLAVPSFSFYAVGRQGTKPNTDASAPTCSGRGPDPLAPSATLASMQGTGNFNGMGGALAIPLGTLTDAYAKREDAGGKGEILTINFTRYARPCGYVRNGIEKIDEPRVSLTLLVQGGGPITTATYNSIPGGEVSVSLNVSKWPATTTAGACSSPNFSSGLLQGQGGKDGGLGDADADADAEGGGGGPPPAGTERITILVLDAAHVEGTFSFEPQGLSGTFNAPFCAQNAGLSPQFCCVP